MDHVTYPSPALCGAGVCLRVMALAFVVWLVPQLTAAQTENAAQTKNAGQTGNAAEDRAQSFQAVSGGVQEDVPGGPLLVIAYAIVWVAVFGYVFRLVRLQKGVDDSLARLEQDLAKATKHAHAPK